VRIENNTGRDWASGAHFVPPERLNIWDASGSTVSADRAETDSLPGNFSITPGGAREGNVRFNVAPGVPLVRVTWTDHGTTIMEAPVP
jgi:hypothetical protein